MDFKSASARLAAAVLISAVVVGPAFAQDDVVDFGGQQVGTTSAPESFVIENYVEEPLVGQPFTLDPLTIRGTDAGSFRIERDACSNIFLDIGDGCEFDVVFSPPWASAGYYYLPPRRQSAELVMTDDIGSPEAVLLLRGTALRPPRLSAGNPPRPVEFGIVPVGRQSAVHRVVMAAQGGDPGTVLGRIGLTGPNADQFALVGEDTCSNRALLQRQTCYFDLQFKPIAQDAKNAIVTVTPGHRLDGYLVVTGTGSPPVTTTLRQVLKRAADRIAGKRLRFAADGGLALGRYRWPVDGTVSAKLSLRGGKVRKRVLASSPEASVVAGDRDSLIMHARRGASRALAKAGKRPRLVMKLRVVEESGTRIELSRKLRVRNAP